MTTWNATLLLVHALGLAGVFFLYRRAPCWMQKVSMALFIVAFAVGSIAFVAALAGHEHFRWPIFLVALVIEHLGVLLYVFRLVYKDHIEWSLSVNFRNS